MIDLVAVLASIKPEDLRHLSPVLCQSLNQNVRQETFPFSRDFVHLCGVEEKPPETEAESQRRPQWSASAAELSWGRRFWRRLYRLRRSDRTPRAVFMACGFPARETLNNANIYSQSSSLPFNQTKRLFKCCFYLSERDSKHPESICVLAEGEWICFRKVARTVEK